MFDGARDLDDGVYAFGAAQQQGVFGHRRGSGLNGVLEVGDAIDHADTVHPRLAVGALRARKGAVGDGDHAHADGGRADLQDHAAPHETRTNDRHPNGLA